MHIIAPNSPNADRFSKLLH